MPITADDKLVMAALSGLGFQSQKLCETTTRSCDLLVTDEHQRYLIEVKSRNDPDGYGARIQGDMPHSESVQVNQDNGVYDHIRQADQQLRSTATHTAHDFRLLWLFNRTRQPSSTRRDQVFGEAYGVRGIAYQLADSTETLYRDCLYARPSVFYRRPKLSGIIVAIDNGVHLLVNPFSLECAQFRESLLYRKFREGGAAFDPSSPEVAEQYFFADGAFDRKNEAALAEFVTKKHGIRAAIVLDFCETSVTIPIPRELY